MIVYGDRTRWCEPERALSALREQLERARAAQLAQERRAALVALTIDLGALAQALLDDELALRGHDELTPLSEAAASACWSAGRALVDGRERGDQVDHESDVPRLLELEDSLRALSILVPQHELALRDPEGYAFYALYPELYLEAALRFSAAQPRCDVQVIGIRSIGTSLSAVVAAALGSTTAPLTVRPLGHPFARELRLGPKLEAHLRAHSRTRAYAIVDEGPGLSGSSFAAVAESLERLGVARERLVFFPSHPGEPGAAASEATRARYRATPRCAVSFEQYFDDSRAERSLARWFVPEVGAAVAPLRELSAGHWRALHYDDPALYPPSYARDERRKYLLTTRDGQWLLKYAGLGGAAPRLAARAGLLSKAGFTPALRAVRHGFALTRFVEQATPLDRADLPRALWVAEVIRYLCFLVQSFPSARSQGAAPDALLSMLKHNVGELMGQEAAETLSRYDALLPSLQETQRVTAVDSKLEPHEWLVTREGRLLKCDAEDHHAGHDCIGSQDPAWDLAGAALELGFDDAELEQARAALLERAAYRLDDAKLRFYQLAYAAFRAGRAHYGEQALRGWNEPDAARVRSERARYVQALQARLRG
ncbi:MAG: cell division protein FtsK [Myxococcaceae bacterium]|nr:cell division protein FtsK [Myxococcaceae bacterium]